jgi:hypothetical protein
MVFVMTNHARKYYAKLNESKHGKFSTMFDFYYLCLIIGIIKQQTLSPKGTEFIDQFTKEFIPKREEIIGLVISSEILRNNIDFENRARIESSMLSIVKPDSSSRLSAKGENIMNQYAEYGFQKILEIMPDPPLNLDTFLISYYENLILS